MTTANELIIRALRLINVPGRGASLAAEDLSQALEALKEILDSEAVSKYFVPGIRRHFFPFVLAKAIYSYGNGPQFDLDSGGFGYFNGDPAPIRIESAYIRQGSAITNNEQIVEYRFRNAGAWVLTGGMAIANNELAVEFAVGSATTIPAAVDLTGAKTYTLRMTIEVNAGSALVELRNNAVTFSSYTLDSSGRYEFDVVWPAGTLPDVRVSSAITDDFGLSLLSLLERGKQRLELPDGFGADLPIRVLDQTGYNLRPVKGPGFGGVNTTPYSLLYSRSAGPAGEIRFQSTASGGDLMVLDVLVNTVTVSQPSDTIGINPEAEKWLRYALADNLAPEYGKSLGARQIKVMESAWDRLAASNRRTNNLGVDSALRGRRRWSINSGGFS